MPPETYHTSANGERDAAFIVIQLTGSDDSAVSHFIIKTLPEHGILKDANGNVLHLGSIVTATANEAMLHFIPDTAFYGDTSFDYAAEDNQNVVDATPATASIHVANVNEVTNTNIASASGKGDDSQISITLSGADMDGTIAHFMIKSLPANGVLKDSNGNILTNGGLVSATANQAIIFFTPNANYYGNTTFLYAAQDNNGVVEDPTPDTFLVITTAVNDAPETNATSGTGNEESVQ